MTLALLRAPKLSDRAARAVAALPEGLKSHFDRELGLRRRITLPSPADYQTLLPPVSKAWCFAFGGRWATYTFTEDTILVRGLHEAPPERF